MNRINCYIQYKLCNLISRSTSFYVLNDKLIVGNNIYHKMLFLTQGIKMSLFNLNYNLIDYIKVRLIIDK